MPQLTPITWPRRTQRSEKRSFCLLNLSFSKRSRPNARTTRTPVRFSCTMAVSLPSASSAMRKRSPTMTKKIMEYPTTIGIKIKAISASFAFMENIRASETTMRNTTRTSSIIWSLIKL